MKRGRNETNPAEPDRRSHPIFRRKSRLAILCAALVVCFGNPLGGFASDAPPRGEELIVRSTATILSGDDWKLGSFPIGEGEGRGAFRTDFNDDEFRTVVVPGEVQLQIGLEGMDLYYQSEKLTLVNEREWWYRKQFDVPEHEIGRTIRLVFEGVDYFCTVWLNGEKLGEHEGAYVPFEYDVTSKVNLHGLNQLTVKVTCPWLPEGRGFLEYMKGELAEVVPGTVTEFPFPPYVLGPTWDGLPAGGNAAFPMGLFRDVKLVVSGAAFVSDLAVATKSLNTDGSATLAISGTIENRSEQRVSATIDLRISPENFQGEGVSLPAFMVDLAPGETDFSQEVTVSQPQLWWTWDTGDQNLYEATATITTPGAEAFDSREVVFGIRTIERDDDMSYRLNGRKVFLKGAWYPISDQFGSRPTRETFETDLELFRAANLNHLVNFTVVEKPEFYDLCDRLGILNFFEFPFIQFGSMAVLDPSNPRREIYVEEALKQVRRIIIELRNHPSIVVWAPFAEAQAKGKGWGVGGHDFEQYGYEEFANAIGALVNELAPGTVFHPSFCDAGEQHYWMGTAGPWPTSPYQEQFQANTGFVSEYGAAAMPVLESMEKMFTPDEIWSEKNEATDNWHGLPIDVAAYSYQTSFDYVGLAGILDRVDRFVDTDIKSVRELVEGSQLYQAFLFQYATEAYRRNKYNSINGTRIWAYGEPTPGIRFGFLDYFRVPKMSYYFLKRAQERFAVNFAYEDALESQVSGKRLRIPVWLINDHLRKVDFEARCEIADLDGKTVWSDDFKGEIDGDSSMEAGVVEWVAPEKPGIYVLRAKVQDSRGSLVTEGRTFFKVTPPLFSRPVRMLLIGQRKYCPPIALMAENLGVDVTVIDEGSIHDLDLLKDPADIRRNFDLVWLGSFDSFWKLLDDQAAKGLKQAIRDGVGFVHSGGPGSFHGGSIRAALLNFTPLADVLPVALLDRDDLFLGQPAAAAFGSVTSTSSVRGIALAPSAPADWRIAGWNESGLPGYNRVRVKTGGTQILSIRNRHPLLVTGRHGKGHTVAFMGFTPTWKERRSPWDRGMVSTHQLDQEMVSDPQIRTMFALGMRMISEAVDESPDTSFDEILASRIRPLFETLQDQPVAVLGLPKILEVGVSNKRAGASLEISSGHNFARLVRIRAEWNEPKKGAPHLVMYGDNYIDLLPGETRTVSLDLRFAEVPRERVEGHLVVEGSNVAETKIPIVLVPR